MRSLDSPSSEFRTLPAADYLRAKNLKQRKMVAGNRRSSWAQIAFLQGERRGQENLKKDLVRRIKMLEYALKQERAKYHKLKYGTELNQGEIKPPSYDSGETLSLS
uniref:Striatin N-terminal domain-containing protein n=1 Tax=Labrus bergylta TaxID=56723 RepID=A0A3Q3FLE6_9LABR